MANIKESPFVCHVFVCTNDRGGKRRSCADGDSPRIRADLKKKVSKRDRTKSVRVSQSGCLGLCSDGPNVIIYPQKIWFSEVSTEDVEQIVSKVEEILDDTT